MLCFVCLTEGRETKAVTYTQGTSVCRQHVIAVGNADWMSLLYKFKEFSERFKERNSNGGSQAAAQSSDNPNG